MTQITLITKNFPPRTCGVGSYTYWLGEEFRKKGYKVKIIKEGNEKVNSKLEFISLPSFSFRNVLINLPSNPTQLIIFQYVAQMYGRAGVCLSLPLFLWKLKKRGKLITTLHELFLPFKGYNFYHNRLKGLILSIIQRLQFVAIVFLSDAIVVTSEERLKLVKKFSPKKTYKIPVGVNFEIHTKKKLNKKEKIILTTFGTLQIEGDYFTLLRGLRLVKEEIENIELRIVGNIDTKFPLYYQIKEEIRKLNLLNNVKWFINIPSWKVIDLLSETDIYVFLKKEGPTGRSTTLVLALALGLPIIAYKGENVDPMFKDKENIILIPKKGIKEWKEGVVSIITDSTLKEKLKTNSKKLFQTYFSWGKIVGNYEKIFEKIE